MHHHYHKASTKILLDFSLIFLLFIICINSEEFLIHIYPCKLSISFSHLLLIPLLAGVVSYPLLLDHSIILVVISRSLVSKIVLVWFVDLVGIVFVCHVTKPLQFCLLLNVNFIWYSMVIFYIIHIVIYARSFHHSCEVTILKYNFLLSSFFNL